MFTCYVDGSYKDPDKGGAAYLIEKQGQIIRYEFTFIKADALSPMETIALLSAVQAAINIGITQCVFYTDAELLAETFKMKSRLM